MQNDQMNEIEEYLLMIFLAQREWVTESSVEYYLNLKGKKIWEKFKQEELGRTIPEEFEFFIGEALLNRLRTNGEMIFIKNKQSGYYKNKIKITVVEE